MVYLNYILSSLSRSEMYIVGYLIDTTKAFEVSSGVQFYLAVENIESHCPIQSRQTANYLSC